jgi:hypothetical protein
LRSPFGPSARWKRQLSVCIPDINPELTPGINPELMPAINPEVTPTINPEVTPTITPARDRVPVVCRWPSSVRTEDK